MVLVIEQIKGGVVTKTAEPHRDDGLFYCHDVGQTMFPIKFATIDEAADFLIANKRGRIRMNPGWSAMVDNIHIDKTPRESL